VLVVGVWDPFRASHAELLDNLRVRAVERNCAAVAVVLDPHPGDPAGFAARYGLPCWPVYDDLAVRIALLRSCGIDAVLCVRFQRKDFDDSAAVFLDAVRRQLRIDELWLGALQQLGPGANGTQAAVRAYAERSGFPVVALPRAPVTAYDPRALLASGRLVAATHQVGRPPTWAQPAVPTLRLGWPIGPYRAVEVFDPSGAGPGAEHHISLRAELSGCGVFSWPAPAIRYLEFRAGPADLRDVTFSGD
jgi:FAD synthase